MYLVSFLVALRTYQHPCRIGQNFLSMYNTSHNKRKFKFSGSLETDSRYTNLNSSHSTEARAGVCKCMCIYLHCIKSLTCHLRHTDSCSIF